DLGHAPLVQVQLLYGSLTPPELDLPGITSRTKALLTDTAKLDLTMFADSHGEETNLVLEYSTDLFDPAWADRFLRCMAHLLEHAANAPGTAVGDLPMLSDEEIDELIVGRNRPAQVSADPVKDVRTLLRESTSNVIDGAGSAPMSEVCDRAARIAGT